MLAKTQGIVLRETKFRDQSKICSLYTRDFGRISVILKGGRNPKNRLSGIFSTGNLLEIVIYRKENRDIQLVREARIVHSPLTAEPDLERYSALYQLIETVKSATRGEERNTRLFDALSVTIERLCSPAGDYNVLLAWFMLRLITSLGFEPSLDRCVLTGREIRPLVRQDAIDRLFLLYEQGGVAVAPKNAASGADRQLLPLSVYLLMIALRDIDVRSIDDLEPSGKTGKQLCDILQNYCARHGEHEPRPKNRTVITQILSNPGHQGLNDVKK
ncbi:DNA repair protein RecO [Prosthecochloris sp. GSB1]|uniref:DNA repair protein RecO n=1 Tax=Prosthecochloris sp. GSB1 TaxID=281093 RepID=UPI000B8CA0C1|nr:DNA repair protein RecO [Prosthecochloris sp. GSB1]ASQ89681.1 DNA repair protein RecO [Prosthecochloris sp. GSB1]